MAESDESNEIKRLYDISATLDADLAKISSEPAKYEAIYDEILQGSKGGQKAKMLVAQLIPKYLPHFPKYTDSSINCLIDLCEEEHNPIRVNAIRALPIIAKISPESLPKLADILGQLLQAELPVELDRVKQALTSLLQQDLKGTLNALFAQTLSEDEDLRLKASGFIFEKVFPMRNEINKSEDLQKSIAENVKKVLPQVGSAKEFQLFTDLLCNLKIYSTGAAASELLDLLADINADFIVNDESVAKLTTCMQSAAHFLAKGATSEKFTAIIATHVLPAYGQMKESQQLSVIQRLTEIALNVNANDAKALLPPLYELILAHIPSPTSSSTDGSEPKINFSIVESALYIFHLLAAKSPGTLRGLCGINVVQFSGQPSMSTELAVDKKKDLDARLKHLEETTSKNFVQPMEEVRKKLLKATTPDELQRKNIIEIALKATHNVLQLSQNLLHKNPTFGATITSKIVLSFKLGKPAAKALTPTSVAPESQVKNATTASPKATPKPSTGAPARPAFGNVYVPPSRQVGNKNKRSPAPSATSQEQPEQPLSLKKHKGRGSSKFQQ